MIAVVILLAWRVWRLESRLEAFDRSLMRKGDVDWLQGALNENLSRCVAGSEQRTHALARALGYEWKRTDAKEGWERKSVNPFGFGIGAYDAYKESVKRAFGAPPLWIHAGPAACVADRRKADRRKPTPEIKVKQCCDSCDEKAVKRAKAQLEREINRPKKRRAH